MTSRLFEVMRVAAVPSAKCLDAHRVVGEWVGPAPIALVDVRSTFSRRVNSVGSGGGASSKRSEPDGDREQGLYLVTRRIVLAPATSAANM